MPSNLLPTTGQQFNDWTRIQQIVAQAIEDPKTNEEVENLIAELGPEYEDSPEAILNDLQAIAPAEGLKVIGEMTPGFDPQAMEPRQVVLAAIETVSYLRAPTKTPPPPTL